MFPSPLRFLAAVLIGLWSGFTASAEIDSFTPRNLALPDATEAINSIIDARITEGVRKANLIEQTKAMNRLESSVCNKATLYTELRKAIFQSFTASWGLKGYALDKQLRESLREYSYHLSLKDSVYRDLDYLEAFSVNLKELSDVVRIDGHLIGIDKLGHFFAEGWRYFEMTALEGENFAAAMAWGSEQEQGKFGYTTTGIFSFADLTANFNGWRFWNNVLAKQKDPLKGTLRNWLNSSFVNCSLQWKESFRQRKLVYAWTYNENFDIGNYIDGTWDEGQNCNSYATPVIEHKIDSRIEELGGSASCPFQQSVCRQARSKYGNYSKWLLHPLCLIDM